MKTTATKKVQAVKPVCNDLSEQQDKATPRPFYMECDGNEVYIVDHANNDRLCTVEGITNGTRRNNAMIIIDGLKSRRELAELKAELALSCSDNEKAIIGVRRLESQSAQVKAEHAALRAVAGAAELAERAWAGDGVQMSTAIDAILIAQKQLAALDKINAIAQAGVIHRSETGKPQWSAFDEIKNIVAAVRGGKVAGS
jgi:hypothetical protein